MKGILRSRLPLLTLVVLALACSFFLLTPKPAAALICPSGDYVGQKTIYYTNAQHTKVACTESCNDDTCVPTPYYIHLPACCSGE